MTWRFRMSSTTSASTSTWIVSTDRETDYLNVFVNLVEVTDDLSVCLGSRGTVVMDFF